MTTPSKLTKQIIAEWEKKELKHPSYGDIARKLLVSRQYVAQVIEKYKLQNAAMGIKKD